MLYQVSKAKKSFAGNDVFENVNFMVKGTEKIALVGRNGCGKTTFLRCVTKEEQFDEGTVSQQNGTNIGYLSQKVFARDEATVKEELYQIFLPLFQIEKEMNQLAMKMAEDHSEEILNKYARLQEQFEQKGGYTWESELLSVFTRFGFEKEDLKKSIGTFSGGQKTRLAFVRLLLSKPDLLLLDEPTNHLDVEAIEWLEGYIKNYPKAVLIVSHDRMFLDHTVDVVYHMEFGTMKRYPGNYSHFVQEKENDLERQQAAYNRQQKDIQRLQTLIEKFRYKKNKAAFAQSKIKYLERMERIDPVKKGQRNFHAHFKSRLKGGEQVLTVDHLKIGYNHVLNEFSFKVRRGDRIAIMGPNGTGKSTLMKTLMGKIPALGGSFLFGHQIEKGYFDQQLAQFSSDKTVIEEVWDEYPELDRTQVRSALGQFLFSADDVFKEVQVLSGGEKVRLSFVKLLLEEANTLLLDEPTNHLDIPGKEALEEALSCFDGTIIFVSHDRYFIQQIATSILELRDNEAVFYPQTYEEYHLHKQESIQEEVKLEKSKEVKKTSGLSPNGIRRKLKHLEEQISKKEEELEAMRELRFEPEYYQDYHKMNLLDMDIDDIHNEIAYLEKEWEELFAESEV
ncbi:ABC-F family ATP-binding cassette domain-containing protein [Bulleidia sp. zg-1006]|uniref:ABC-F family ATP-binding cassette domain-containing protein n=1 Tax=Bulleidia sp. zg-1006 TaxID=2806552 RepID=UPI00193A2996|nr:ABC-F type ribosomal protection protein [Bulleidia sp. zg-1006]QRG86818.1 ABC-F type ribosomal protection protein [Bulleidia sp. zg-1006]